MPGAFTGEQLISDYHRQATGKVQYELERMSTSQLVDIDEDELAEALTAKHELEPLEIDSDRELIDECSESEWYDAGEQFIGGSRRQEMVYDKLAIPLVPRQSNASALRIHASRWLMSTGIETSATFREHDHRVVLRAQEGRLPRMLDHIKQLMAYINTDIASHTPGFRQQVKHAVQMRSSQVAGQRQRREDMMRSLNVPIAQRQGAIKPVKVQVRREIKVLREQPAKPASPKELYLEPESEQAIVGMIHQAGKGFETTPAVYSRLDEEELRSIILNNLNTVFDAFAATGETFLNRGKTDIYLNVQGRAIPIAECKKWKGAQKYAETLDQRS